ncbi:hypothetical protein ABIC94_002851 [Variovorax paradoxus]|uniref:hypothetical protein n=1 Tax=Variovorax paradoxus TaxID=34073 RepID=UPI00339B55EC
MRLRPFLLGAAVFFCMMALWVAALQLFPRPIEASWIEGIYEKKEAAASRIEGPKLVIIGGSGTHYSYSAEELSRLTGFQVVNLGTHAGLGGDYILHRARASLKSGDVAVLALEHQLVYRSRPSTVLSTFVLTSDPRYLLSAPLQNIPALLFGYPPVQVIRQAAARSIPYNSPLYRPETVTASGDESANMVANKLPYMAATVSALPALNLRLTPNPHVPAPFLLAFARWARKHQVGVVQAWPATTFRSAYLTPNYEAYFERYAQTYRNAGFLVVGRPERYLLPENLMLDSMYHADFEGAKRISRVFAEDLCKAIVCPRNPLRVTGE